MTIRAVVSMKIESTGLQNKIFKALGKKKNYQHKTVQPVNLKNARLNKAIYRQTETFLPIDSNHRNFKNQLQKEKSHAWKIKDAKEKGKQRK